MKNENRSHATVGKLLSTSLFVEHVSVDASINPRHHHYSDYTMYSFTGVDNFL